MNSLVIDGPQQKVAELALVADIGAIDDDRFKIIIGKRADHSLELFTKRNGKGELVIDT